jgi:hypothetical protein
MHERRTREAQLRGQGRSQIQFGNEGTRERGNPKPNHGRASVPASRESCNHPQPSLHEPLRESGERGKWELWEIGELWDFCALTWLDVKRLQERIGRDSQPRPRPICFLRIPLPVNGGFLLLPHARRGSVPSFRIHHISHSSHSSHISHFICALNAIALGTRSNLAFNGCLSVT